MPRWVPLHADEHEIIRGRGSPIGLYCCMASQQWVVCDLMNNSRTVYARSVDFDKACAADVLE